MTSILHRFYVFHCRQRKKTLSDRDTSDTRSLHLLHILNYKRIGHDLIPIVYAAGDSHAEVSTELGDNGQSCTTTTVDLLASGRPKILITDDEVKIFIDNEQGVDRVRAMFTKDKNGDISGDLASVIQIAQTCGFFFFLVTSVAGGIAARDRYLEKNKTTVYATRFQALRAYNDAIFFGSMKFGLKWGLKSALFAAIFTLTSQTLSVYFNRTSVIDYVVGGGLTCALLRMNMGLRGMFAGGVIGSGLGLLGGTAMSALLYLTNETQQHRHFLHVHQVLRDKRETEILAAGAISRPVVVTSDVTD